MTTLKDVVKTEKLNEDVVFKLLIGIHQLNDLQLNLVDELKWECDRIGVYQYSVKKNINELKKGLKSNFGNKWAKFDDEQTEAYCGDMDIVESLFKNALGLTRNAPLMIAPKFKVGDMVFCFNNGFPTLCRVDNCRIRVDMDKDGKKDTSHYILTILQEGSLHSREKILVKNEDEIFNSKDELLKASGYEN